MIYVIYRRYLDGLENNARAASGDLRALGYVPTKAEAERIVEVGGTCKNWAYEGNLYSYKSISITSNDEVANFERKLRQKWSEFSTMDYKEWKEKWK